MIANPFLSFSDRHGVFRTAVVGQEEHIGRILQANRDLILPKRCNTLINIVVIGPRTPASNCFLPGFVACASAETVRDKKCQDARIVGRLALERIPRLRLPVPMKLHDLSVMPRSASDLPCGRTPAPLQPPVFVGRCNRSLTS